MNNNIVEGIVRQRLSRKTYMVELNDGSLIHVHLAPSYIWNYLRLSIDEKIYVRLIPPDNKEGTLWTDTNNKRKMDL
ncbi:MAG: hypothetical protein R3E32_14020 [Chitinophagales bacterium]